MRSLLRPSATQFMAMRLLRAPGSRALCKAAAKPAETSVSTEVKEAKADAVAEAPLTNERGEVIKTWGETVDLPAVSPKEAEDAYLDATSVTRSMTPPIAEAVAARDDMLHDRFNYVAKNLNPDSQYVVMGGKGKVAPAAISQASFIIAGLVVVLGGIASVFYVKTQWGVSNAKEFGDRMREKGQKRKEALERSSSATLVRSVSSRAETSVKENIELVRRPSQQLGSHLDKSFKGVVAEGRKPGTAVGLATAAVNESRAAAA